MMVHIPGMGRFRHYYYKEEDDDEDATLEEEEEERKEVSESRRERRNSQEQPVEEDDWEAEIDAICGEAKKPPHYDSDDVLSPDMQLAGTSQVPSLRPDLVRYNPSMHHSLPILWQGPSSEPRAPRPLATPEQFEDAEEEEE